MVRFAVRGSLTCCWHLPIGVLFDMHRDVVEPWNINVHFGDFPSGELLKWSSEEHVKQHLFHALKEVMVLTGRCFHSRRLRI